MSEEESEYSEYSEESEESEDRSVCSIDCECDECEEESANFEFDPGLPDYLAPTVDNFDGIDNGTSEDLSHRGLLNSIKKQLRISLMREPLDTEIERALELTRAIRFWLIDLDDWQYSYFLTDNKRPRILNKWYLETIRHCIVELRDIVLNNCSKSMYYYRIIDHFYLISRVTTPRRDVVELMKYLIGKKDL